MNEEIVSFETAKLAKEKSFNWDSLYAYDDEGCKENASELNAELYFSEEHIKNSLENGYITYLAPTQSLLAKWLRDIHKINVVPQPYSNFDDETNNFSLWKYVIEGETWFFEKISPIEYKTYEEAMEAGLLRALNLIKDKKNE